MARRNNPNEIDQSIISDVQDTWQKHGKIWDINPPSASHFGGVWERKIGQMRRIIEGHMLSDQHKTMDKEQFTTMLLHAASIVNSTPLWDPADSPNDPQPISPQRLLTQRDDTCKDKNFFPTTYTKEDLRAYGPERWKRIEAIANQLWQDWTNRLLTGFP